jgi:hypothetical protein
MEASVPGDPEPTHAPLIERPEQRAAIICDERQGPTSERTSMLSAGAILIADGVFDLLVGAALIASTITSASGLLGAGSLKPWPLFVVIGAGCLAVSGLLLAASTRPDAAAMCRSIWQPNMLSTVASVALLLVFPHLAHPYVVALTVASIGFAVFGTLEWTTSRQK